MNAFDLVFLEHAIDRMEDRGISKAEVNEVWAGGVDASSEALQGMIRIDGTTDAGRRLSILRLASHPVVVSVVEAEE